MEHEKPNSTQDSSINVVKIGRTGELSKKVSLQHFNGHLDAQVLATNALIILHNG